ncbi:protein shisa-3-like [Uloborus diversus]|uniref:protein shisa-3-like n=1 Tax=Uloborus diversus TaxID=327109 RepID=UPI00240A7ABA|nr:protein shisa-3-like [Uloborus diversus]
MDFKEEDLKELTRNDHEVLGSDFCSGYTDVFGKWNTGFACPRLNNGETVYCCGTVLYKYCCTRKEQNSSSGMSQSIIVGSTIGSIMVIVLVVMVSCIVCKKCPPCRRAHSSLNGGPLYNLQCSSSMSGVGNFYSFSGQTTASTTPLDNPHTMVDLDTMNSLRSMNHHISRTGLRYDTPTDPPPPYIERPSNADESFVNTDVVRNSTEDECIASQSRQASNHLPKSTNPLAPQPQAKLYTSTKF